MFQTIWLRGPNAMKIFLLSRILAFIWMGTLIPVIKVDAQPSPVKMLKETLKGYQWEKRILLVGSPSAQQADFVRQKAILAKEEAGLRERDIQVIEILYDQLAESDRTFLRKELAVPINVFNVVLIGKDGGIKLKQSTPMTMEALFPTVDAMPMRRQEMRKN